ncbi:MAG TPA: PP2C family protein-serine/threonine phosphatase [Acidobacteriaceae bacterium]|jgi:sigma-B regulation protein RsbU (phosphoserine phosphatase)|nr:PP2C family protein-serine/threonine phosphatase [Acidobacteriaceae bacterium]
MSSAATKEVLHRLMRPATGAREQERAEARALQESLLPPTAPPVAGYTIALAWQGSPEVSGDYFDVFSLRDDQTALCIADVSGKGLAAAKLASELQTAVRGFAPEAASPAELCTQVNQALCRPGGDPRMITMFYGVLDAAEKRLRYENAGHCLPLLVRADGAVEFPASFSGVVGIFSHWLYQNQEVELRSGDCLLLLTDGLLQAENRRRQEFGYQRLIAAVERGHAQGAEKLSQEILAEVGQFIGGKWRDDASLIVVTVD